HSTASLSVTGPQTCRRKNSGLQRRPGRSTAVNQNLVDQAVSQCSFRVHKVIAFGIGGNLFNALTGMVRQNSVQTLFGVLDIAGMDLTIRCLSLGATARLVNHSA